MISLTMSREDWRTGSIPELPLLRMQKFKAKKGERNGKRKAFFSKDARLGSYRWNNSWINLYNFPLEIKPIIKPVNKTRI